MAKKKSEKRKVKRKKKLEERRERLDQATRREKTDFLFYEAIWYWDNGNLDKALYYLERALRLDPKNEELLTELGRLGHELERPDVELKALLSLYNNGWLAAEMMPALCQLLRMDGKYKQALSVIQETLTLVPEMKVRNKKSLKASLVQEQKYCQFRLEAIENLVLKDQ